LLHDLPDPIRSAMHQIQETARANRQTSHNLAAHK
jgi:hypothetical protein